MSGPTIVVGPSPNPMGISAGTQSASTGTMVFSNSNGISFGMSGSSRITASYTVPNVPAETPFGLSAGTQSVSTGTLIFSNSNNVSFGMSGSSRVTASASFAAETPFGISGGTQSVSTGTLIFSDSNGISFGMSGSSRITASYTVPTETPFGVSAGTQSVSTGTLVFSNSNNVSFGMSGSSRVTATASFPAETPFGVSAGTQSVSTGTLVFSDSNGVTFGMSGSSRVTGSFSTVVFSNSNNVSFGLNAGTLTATATGAETPFGISAGTQSISTGTLVFSDSNGISFGMSGSSRVTATYTRPVVSNAMQDISTATGSGTGTSQFAAHDHVHRGLRAWNVTNTASTFFGDLAFSEGNFIDISTGGNTTAGTIGIHCLLSTATTVSSVTSGNVVGTNSSRFALEDHQHAGVGPLGVSNLGNTAGNTGTQFGRVVFAGTNVTLSVSSSNNGAQTITISGNVGGGAGYTAGFSTMGNTLGDTGLVTGRLVLVGSNNITLSGSTNAGSMTVTISGPTGGGMGVSTGGNTVGTTGTVGAQVVFVGGNNITLSQSTAAGGSATVTISAQNINAVSNAIQSVSSATNSGTGVTQFAAHDHVHAGVGPAGVSNIGNTLGNTTVAHGRIVFAGGNNITLSVSSSNNNAQTITIQGIPIASRYAWPPAQGGSYSSIPQSSNSIEYVPVYYPVTFTRLDFAYSVSLNTAATSNTAGVVISRWAGVYSKNAATLFSIATGSTQETISWASNTGSYSSITGNRFASVPVAGFLMPGEYFVAFNMATAQSSIGANTTALAPQFNVFGYSVLTNQQIFDWGATNTSTNWPGGKGLYSAQVASAMTQISLSDIVQTGSAFQRANIWVMFRNV